MRAAPDRRVYPTIRRSPTGDRLSLSITAFHRYYVDLCRSIAFIANIVRGESRIPIGLARLKRFASSRARKNHLALGDYADFTWNRGVLTDPSPGTRVKSSI